MSDPRALNLIPWGLSVSFSLFSCWAWHNAHVETRDSVAGHWLIQLHDWVESGQSLATLVGLLEGSEEEEEGQRERTFCVVLNVIPLCGAFFEWKRPACPELRIYTHRRRTKRWTFDTLGEHKYHSKLSNNASVSLDKRIYLLNVCICTSSCYK